MILGPAAWEQLNKQFKNGLLVELSYQPPILCTSLIKSLWGNISEVCK